MSSGLVIAKVTTTLKESLMDWLLASPDVPGSRPIEIAALPPARSMTDAADDGLKAHFYLYRISVNPGQRSLPVGASALHEEPGSRAPEIQGLQLDYLIGVTPTRELDPEIVLGAALDWALKEPVLTVQVPTHEAGLPTESWQLRISLIDLNVSELVALCGAIEGRYRAHLAISVQVVVGATGAAAGA